MESWKRKETRGEDKKRKKERKKGNSLGATWRRRCRTRRTRRWKPRFSFGRLLREHAVVYYHDSPDSINWMYRSWKEINAIPSRQLGRGTWSSIDSLPSRYPLLLIVRLIRSGRRLGSRSNTRFRYPSLQFILPIFFLCFSALSPSNSLGRGTIRILLYLGGSWDTASCKRSVIT